MRVPLNSFKMAYFCINSTTLSFMIDMSQYDSYILLIIRSIY